MIRKQIDVLARLEQDNRRAIRAVEDAHLLKLAKLWAKTTRDLKAHLHYVHRQNHEDGKWDIADAFMKGTLKQFNVVISEIMTHFRAESSQLVAHALAEIRHLEESRAVWMLSQVVPSGIKLNVPHIRKQEADVPLPPEDTWSATWMETVDAWSATLSRNFRLAAVSSSSPDKFDAIVDGTRVGYPSYNLWDSLNRLYVTASISAQAEAQVDVSDANPEVVREEIWQTLEDAKVCVVCQDNFGETRDSLDAEGVFLPAHPNDRCFWRLVPKEWAELLRSGDEFQQAMALQMDDQQLVDDAMAVYGADGKTMVGTTTIRFEDWDPDVAQQEYETWKADWTERNPSKGELINQWQGGGN